MIATTEDMTDEQKLILKEVTEKWEASDKLHRQFSPRWNDYYGLYRNYRKLRKAYSQAATDRERTEILEVAREQGRELFIPYIFATIETVLPRILATDPRMSVTPNKPAAERATEPVKHLFERRQSQIRYGMRLQQVAKSGLMYGLGVGKTGWEEKYRTVRRNKPRLLGGGFKVEESKELVDAGPIFDPVDIFDFRWDPAAADIETAGYVIHRVWRPTSYVKQMVEEKHWPDLDLEKVKGYASDHARGEAWADRMDAAGIAGFQPEGEPLHEIWEYHDRENVYTVLDKCLVVQADRNPHFHGDIPFQIYRPTIVPHEFCGIGEAEPLAHLQRELNEIRTQRRDAAEFVLNRGYFYARGMLDEEDFVIGPGVMVPVMGDPREVIHPMPFTDLPASSVSEEEALKLDIERASGISDPITGTTMPGSQANATAIQLVQAAANFRIGQKAKNLTGETIASTTPQWLAMYRQRLLTDQDLRVEVPDSQSPTGVRHEWVKVGPGEVNADLEVLPVDGSTEPENTAQKRADVQQLVNTLIPLAEPAGLDMQRLAEHVLREYGVPRPDEWIKPPTAFDELVPALGNALADLGVDPEVVTTAFEQVLQQQQPEGPPADFNDEEQQQL